MEIIDEDTLSSMKVKDLQKELKQRDLPTAGLKAVLQQRLRDHFEQIAANKGAEEEPSKEPAEVNADEPSAQSPPNVEEEKLNLTPIKDSSGENKADKDKSSDKANTSDAKSDDQSTQEQEGSTEEKPLVKDSSAEASSSSKRKELDEDNDAQDPPAKRIKLDSQADDQEMTSPSADEEKDVATETLRIDNFLRPFTLTAAKELVQTIAPCVEDGFWMDAIKTHCFVTYASVDTAVATKEALDGRVWPAQNGQALSVTFSKYPAYEAEKRLSENKNKDTSVADPPASTTPKDTSSETKPTVMSLDRFFRKTETKPVLYYLPLTDDQIAQKKRKNQQRKRGRRRQRKMNKKVN